MDIFEAIYTRRSIRKFLDTPLEEDKVVEVIRAGTYAPCAGDLQNWKFILETNIKNIRSLYHHTLEQEAFMTAQAAIIVVAETDIAEKFYGMRGKRLYAIQNCAAAIQNMLLAAHALGLGAVWIGAFDENRINDMYKIPSTARTQGIILLGYPDEKPEPRHMKHPWFLINFHKYGLKYEHIHRITNDLSQEWELQSDHLRRAGERVSKKIPGLKLKDWVEKKPKISNNTEQGRKDETKKAGASKQKDIFKEAKRRGKRFLQQLKKEEYQDRSKMKRKSGVKRTK